jgi:uracil-DNA glycosylase family 4
MGETDPGQATGPSEGSLAELERQIVSCRRCPRLVEWREQAAADPPRRFRGQDYWAKPIQGFGDPEAGILIVGLAPAANGANRTGRIFTGDRAGDWLFASLYRTGLANQPESVKIGDGLRLEGAWISAVVRCAPPANKPSTVERDNCLPYLERELQLMENVRVIVALGGFAWDGVLRGLRAAGRAVPTPKPRFGHGAEAMIGDRLMLGCYHPSQQNTFTGRLDERMTDEVFSRAILAGREAGV